MIYKTYTTTLGQEFVKIEHGDGSVTCIPPDPANTDFLQYQKWLSEGNVPLPPDEPTLPETI